MHAKLRVVIASVVALLLLCEILIDETPEEVAVKSVQRSGPSAGGPGHKHRKTPSEDFSRRRLLGGDGDGGHVYFSLVIRQK